MRVLVACEFSGIVRNEFSKLGHDAWSCDLLPTEIPGNHYQRNVLEILNDGWDLMIAHPPCTYLTNAGVRHLHSVPSRLGSVAKVHGEARWVALREAAEFFKLLLGANIPRIAVENPVPHHYAVDLIGRKYDQLIQPWMFGHRETKKTCLWLKNLPKLTPTDVVTGNLVRNDWSGGNSSTAWMKRSRTYLGIAKAMAEQWGRIENIQQGTTEVKMIAHPQVT